MFGANKYNDSWHPSFANRFVSFLNPQTGWHTLDLACGTGLVTFAAVRSVGPSGSVTGVDVSDGMLSVARNELSRLKSQESCWENIELHHHDITRLKELEPIRGKKFDAITCVSALFLLDSPHTAIKSWIGFLRHGGTLVVDISDRTKAQSSTSQYLETMKHGSVRFLIFCGSKEHHRRDMCYK